MPIHPGLTYAEYDALPGLRSGQLKLLRESPKHYRNPPPRKGWSADLRLIHALVLEPEEVARSWVRWPAKRGAKGWDLFEKGNFGKEIATATEWDRAAATAAAILRNEDVAPLLALPGASELSLTWTRPDGLQCKARLDRWVAERGETLDIKTYGTTVLRAILGLSDRHGAQLQAAHYMEGIRACLDPSATRYGLVVAEDAQPYDTVLCWLTQEALDVAAAERERLIARLLDCQASGRWPGRHDGPQELGPPVWRAAGEDEDTALETENLFGPESWAVKEDAS